MTQPRHRSTIINYATRYEITMTTPEGTTVLGYTPRRTRSALITTMQAHKDAVLAALGGGNAHLGGGNDFGWDAKNFRFANEQGFSVGFSGVTERQAADVGPVRR